MMMGRFDNIRAARAFSDWLRKLGLPHRLVETGPREVELWVEHEEAQEAVRRELARFREDPDHPRYLAASWQAPPPEAVARDLSRRYGGLGALRPRRLLAGRGPVTLLVFAACILASFWSGFATREGPTSLLMFPEPAGSLLDVAQPWRLLTPVLLHLDGLHLVSNLLWWWLLGAMIERYQGSFQLVMLVLVIGLGSNVAQYLDAGPGFGGLSGVIYGLMGYLWLYGRVNPAAGYQLRPAFVNFMLLWMLLCFTGLMGPVANTAHLAGLLAGAVLGVVFGVYRRRVYYRDR